ncbi:hypothetical protein L210DRAFT_3520131 [Boletus edulis BED1]|uniref:Uncharacterized protein n=1 Tax=Boletus edulis BED1 TaxID=1328754 RepID=A0AAD4C5W6_BOLED|nr:hypothetical protein L210DRAFT_3520131 [Boletus edulis BED1]
MAPSTPPFPRLHESHIDPPDSASGTWSILTGKAVTSLWVWQALAFCCGCRHPRS